MHNLNVLNSNVLTLNGLVPILSHVIRPTKSYAMWEFIISTRHCCTWVDIIYFHRRMGEWLIDWLMDGLMIGFILGRWENGLTTAFPVNKFYGWYHVTVPLGQLESHGTRSVPGGLVHGSHFCQGTVNGAWMTPNYPHYEGQSLKFDNTANFTALVLLFSPNCLHI